MRTGTLTVAARRATRSLVSRWFARFHQSDRLPAAFVVLKVTTPPSNNREMIMCFIAVLPKLRRNQPVLDAL